MELDRWDIEAWAARSRKGEVCGILGCPGGPVIKCGHCDNHYCRDHCFLIAQLGHRSLTHPKCVVCGAAYSGGRYAQWSWRELTCSDACHEELANRLVSIYGEFKKVIRASTGEAFKVPTRDIIEKGVRGQELDRYPRWEESDQNKEDCPECHRLVALSQCAASDLERDLAKTNLVLHLQKDHRFSSFKILEMTGVWHD